MLEHFFDESGCGMGRLLNLKNPFLGRIVAGLFYEDEELI